MMLIYFRIICQLISSIRFFGLVFGVWVMNLIDEDAPGHENHVHSWWDFVFDTAVLDRHLEQLKEGKKEHPSAPVLVDIFLSNRRKQLDGGHVGNAALLLKCAVEVVMRLGWSLEVIERELSDPDQARMLLREGGVGIDKHWSARYELRRYMGQTEETARILAWVQELENVAEARNERCRALFVAGLVDQAHAIAEPGSLWWLLTNGNVFEGKKEVQARPHKRPIESASMDVDELLAVDEIGLERFVQDALKRGELEEAKKATANLYDFLKAAEAKRASLKYK
jgi:hypothetical protein